MMGVQPLQNCSKSTFLRCPQAEPLGRRFIATRLAILDQDGESAVAQRQSVARVHHVRGAVAGTVGSADNGVTSGRRVSSRDGAEQAAEDFGGVDAGRPGQDRGVARHVNEHIVVQHNVALEQMPTARWIIVQVKDDVRLPAADEAVDGHRLAAEQQLVVPVQINPVCVAAGPGHAAVRIRLRNNGQLDGWKPRGHFLGRQSEQGLDRPPR